jgi:hypothetical protein
MRIIIEIEGANVTISTPGVPATPLDSLSAPPPPGLFEAAARVGALSAGPAPARPGEAYIGADRLGAPRLGAMTCPDSGLDAGKAPAASGANPSGLRRAGRKRGPTRRRGR